MPAKKRTSTVANSDATGPSKRTRKPVPETAASSRPKRLSFVTLPPRAAKTKTATVAPAAAKPRTASASKAPDTPKKRGRPSLKATTPVKETKEKPTKQPKKVTTTAAGRSKAAATTKKIAAGKLAKRRGRPPKSSLPSTEATATTTTSSKKRKRTVGKPKQVSNILLPKKGSAGKLVKKQPVTRRPRKPLYLNDKEPDLTIEVAEDDAYGPDGRSYWLMKAEPESRLVKGVDVKFSIDDLRAATEPEPWDGVRNPVARNNIRAMKQGDYAFFYHSSCKVPGIVGEMEIVKEHSVDAFDPAHPYYDEKSSRENPKWEVVHVEFRRKFDKTLTLETLKAHALPGFPLDGLQTIRQSRVSVSRVTPKEWEYIKNLIDEQNKIDEKADTEMKDFGEAEADTNGEAETANETAPEPASEPIPEPQSASGAAEPAPSPAPPTEPTTAASNKQPVEGVQKHADKPEENGSKGEDSLDKRSGESNENGVNGQTTTERLASVITGAFLTS
ncbi:hypothetical protein UA08_08236 [Talaromyces atroroseus]|uniref:Thymocyte nuclear protein 1 n=1 Tax=Talaromyces atroroseus TaxID=1441469 RepID=A0A225AM52_TALAT|nr:hypothetical protein UA08_08236 [Talaromyces atroroseus]OKL56649.1 hypothetical protein UA08_08236 [Talaromyces atroroseus]